MIRGFLNGFSFLIFSFYSPLLLAQLSNDPLFSWQWYLTNDGTQTIPIGLDPLNTVKQAGIPGVDIAWKEAHPAILAFQKNPVLVAVIDYGVDPTHPDLVGRLSSEGFDFLKKSSTLVDDFGHGTNISGIIAANTNNALGVAGITGPQIKVLPLRVLNKDFKNFVFNNRLISDYVADAIRYAVQKKASVINLSLGWPKLVDTENARRAVQEAISQGVVVVAAAGNDLKQQPTYPCAYPGVICVGAVTNTGELSLYSNWGGKVDVLAPGDYIISTYPQNVESESLRRPGYEALSGTSQAAPIISSMAAILKSFDPTMTVPEVAGRIFAASQRPPNYSGMPAAQYGLPKLTELMKNPSKPIYQVDYKAIESILVDEGSLKTAGSIPVVQLLGSTGPVEFKLLINNKLSGTLKTDELKPGARVLVPWTYQFASLDESADMRFDLQVTDSQGTQKSFAANLAASRKSLDISLDKSFPLPVAIAKTGDWLANNQLGRLAGRAAVVANCGQSTGLPEYFRIKSAGKPEDLNGATLEIISFSPSLQLRALTVPSVTNLVQVIHCKEHLPNDFEWVVTSLWKDESGTTYFQFYFLDKDLKPYSKFPLRRYKSQGNSLDGLIPRNYASSGSFVRHSSGELVPAFLDVGVLPKIDNFDSFDPRSKAVSQHLYFLEPDPKVNSNTAGLTELRLRAFDSKAWMLKYPENSILQPLPQNQKETLSGARKFLFGAFSDLSKPLKILTLTDLAHWELSETSWARVDSMGDRSMVLSPQQFADQMTFVAYTDLQHGSLAWTDSLGRFLGRSEFAYQNVGDPFVGKIIGIYKLVNDQSKYWFLQSHNNLVGFFETASGAQKQATFSLERDSSFEANSFNLLFAPTLVGSSQVPLPGIFVDSTQIVGNRVNVITYNSGQNKLERLLRYSLSIPDACINMAPIRLDFQAGSFSLPLICLPANRDQGLFIAFVQP